jgi:hypothetical protein
MEEEASSSRALMIVFEWKIELQAKSKAALTFN